MDLLDKNHFETSKFMAPCKNPVAVLQIHFLKFGLRATFQHFSDFLFVYVKMFQKNSLHQEIITNENILLSISTCRLKSYAADSGELL